jgi:serine protease Do
MVRIIGCVAIVLLMISGTMRSENSNLTDETHKKERVKGSGWIGIMIQDVSEKTARKAKLDSEEGAYVNEVMDNSPADSAGIQEGDVIILFNEKKIFDAEDLMKIVQRTTPGTKATLVTIRDGQKKTLQLTVGKSKMQKHEMLKHEMFGVMPHVPDVRVILGNHFQGLQLLTLNEQLGEYFGVPNNEGVLVEEVEHESAAEKAGFKAGDIILRIGKKTIDAVEKVQKELRKYDEGEKVEFEIMRKNAKKSISLEMEEEQDMPQKFFFRKPHMRMFRTNPFDDANMQLEMDDVL